MGAPPTILLVEDDADDEELTLRGLRGARLVSPVDVARDGQEALDHLLGTDGLAPEPVPALVLLDLKLPRVGGLQVLERIRAHRRTRRVPVVILTSSNEARDITAGYDRGANSYVRKPIEFAEFTSTIAQLGVYWLAVNEPAPAG